MPRNNYKEFKKIHEDASVATLKHPDGHEVKIAKGALSDHMKKQISSLKFCDGGEVQHFDTGGDVQPMTDAKGNSRDPSGNRYDKYNPPLDASKSNPNYKETPEKPKPQPVASQPVMDSLKHAFGYAEGGPVEEQHGGMSMPDGTEMQPSMQQAPDVINQMANLGLPDTASQAPSGPTNPVIPQAPEAPQMPAQQNYAAQGMGQQLQGIAGQAQAEAKLGAGELQDARQNTQRLQDLDKLHVQNQTKIQNELDSVIHDYNQQKIDPNHFWNSKSTLGKASTAIGLILGGMSAGVTGGPNPALQFLNQQIDRDVEGQKSEAGRKMTMISALQHQLGNNIDATNMAKAMQAGVFASKLMEEAAKSKDPMAMARAQQASGQILATYGPLVQKTALRQTVLQGMRSGSIKPEEAVPYLDIPEAHQKEIYSEIKKAQDAAQLEKPILENFDKAAKENTALRTGFGHLRTPVSIQTLNAMSLPMIHDQEGRVNEYEQKTLQDLMPQPGDTDAKIAGKRQGWINFMTQKQSTPVSNSFGIHIPKSTASKFHK